MLLLSVTFDEFNATLLNKSINLLKNVLGSNFWKLVYSYTWGLFHKTSLPNKPGLFQLVWLILNQINWQ